MRTLYISAYYPALGDPFGEEAVHATSRLMMRLRIQGYKPHLVRSKYNGKQELTVMVENYGGADTELARTLRFFQQDQALVVVGTEMFLDNGYESKYIGKAEYVSACDAEPQDDYTFLPEYNSYMKVQEHVE